MKKQVKHVLLVVLSIFFISSTLAAKSSLVEKSKGAFSQVEQFFGVKKENANVSKDALVCSAKRKYSGEKFLAPLLNPFTGKEFTDLSYDEFSLKQACKFSLAFASLSKGKSEPLENLALESQNMEYGQQSFKLTDDELYDLTARKLSEDSILKGKNSKFNEAVFSRQMAFIVFVIACVYKQDFFENKMKTSGSFLGFLKAFELTKPWVRPKTASFKYAEDFEAALRDVRFVLTGKLV